MYYDNEDRVIDNVLKNTKTIALIGASVKEERPSNSVMRNLLNRGYQVFPVNPGHAGGKILGQVCFARLTDIPHEIDMVDVFRRSEDLPEVAQQAVAVGAKSLWVQLGLWSVEAASIATQSGLDVVMDRCLKIEHARFHGGLHLAGFDTGVIDSRINR